MCGRQEWDRDYCPTCVEEYYDALKLIQPALRKYSMCDFKDSNLEFTYGILLEIWRKKNAEAAKAAQGDDQDIPCTT